MRRIATLTAFLLLSVFAPAKADQTDSRLDGLFAQLLEVKSFGDARPVESNIWEIWTHSDDDVVRTLMQEGLGAMGRRDFSSALRKFDQMVEIAPDFAEAWNKRATVHYLMDNYAASLADIEKTLALEPRHFGALAGQGLVLGALKELEAALEAFEKALAIHPNLTGAQRNAEALRKYLKDQEI